MFERTTHLYQIRIFGVFNQITEISNLINAKTNPLVCNIFFLQQLLFIIITLQFCKVFLLLLIQVSCHFSFYMNLLTFRTNNWQKKKFITSFFRFYKTYHHQKKYVPQRSWDVDGLHTESFRQLSLLPLLLHPSK